MGRSGMVVMSVVVAAAAVGFYLGVQRADTGQCPVGTPLPTATPEAVGECFFSSSYYDSRDKFRAAAQLLGAELHTRHIDGGPGDVDLSIDFAVVHRERADRVVVHMSGVHGAEAYAGSAIQLAAMNELRAKRFPELVPGGQGEEAIPMDESRLPTLVFVHAVNPYGFAHHRRVNENNVDLNRNFVTEETLEELRNRDPNIGGYVDLDGLMNPTSFPTSFWFINDIVSFSRQEYTMYTVGMTNAKRALVAGNYHKPEGIGYGGRTVQQSVRVLTRFLAEFTENAQRIAQIDVHTGLGPVGVDTLLVHGADRSKADVSRWFHEEETGGYGAVEMLHQVGEEEEGASAGYELTRGTSGEMCEFVYPSRALKLAVAQEFGTIPMPLTAKNLMEENVAYHHGTPEQREFYAKRLLSSFFVQTRSWKRDIVRRGLKVLHEAENFAAA